MFSAYQEHGMTSVPSSGYIILFNSAWQRFHGVILMSARHRVYDVIIIGAGVFGLATAHYLKERDPDLHCLVVDRSGGFCQGNSAKSAAMYRVAFASEVNRQLATATVSFFEHLQHEKGVDIGLQEVGYLWLLSRAQWDNMEPTIRSMRQEKRTELETYTREELEELIPQLRTSFPQSDEDAQLIGLPEIHRGVYFKRCGKVEPTLLGSYYLQAYRERNGDVLFKTEVKRIVIGAKEPLGLDKEPTVWQEPEIKGIETIDGKLIKGKTIIVATGAWTPHLLDPLGIDSHVKPKKRQLFQIKHSKLRELLHNPNFNGNSIPFTILPKASVYFRPNIHDNSIWVGCSDNLGREFDTCDSRHLDNPQPEQEFYEFGVYPILSAYFPILQNIPIDTSWAGHYTYNTVDKNPYVFRAKEVPDIIVSTGGSGSGIMKSDSIGRITAAVYFGDEEASLFDGTKFPVKRLGVLERNVDHESLVI